MLYFSSKNKKKIVHFDNCPFVNLISKENKQGIKSVSLAIKEGYQLCDHCNPLKKLYEKDKEKVREYCYQNLIALDFRGHEISLTTLESKWKVIPTSGTKYALYHANERIEKDPPKTIVPGYHLQDFYFDNLLTLCEYILSHDQYRCKYPVPLFTKRPSPPKKGTKRWKKKEKRIKISKKKKDVRNVLKIINSL